MIAHERSPCAFSQCSDCLSVCLVYCVLCLSIRVALGVGSLASALCVKHCFVWIQNSSSGAEWNTFYDVQYSITFAAIIASITSFFVCFFSLLATPPIVSHSETGSDPADYHHRCRSQSTTSFKMFVCVDSG